MLTVTEAQARVSDLVTSAKNAGADAADVLYSGGVSTEVQVRLGELEDVQRSEGEEIGLRFFVGQRSASVSSSDLSADALATLVERAAAMAREAPEDAYAGLAPADRLFHNALPDLDIDDGCDAEPEALRASALEAEDAARAVDGVTNSEGGGASASRSIMALATSHGFCGGYQASNYGCSASVIAGEGSDMQRDYAYRTARHLADLDSAASIGRRAAERTVARLNPAKLPSGAMPVVFDPRVSGGLLGHLIGAITGSAITRGTSFLRDCLGEQVFQTGVSVLDNPLRKRGLRSRPFDGEGLPVAESAIIDDGVLTSWLLDSASARQLGLEPTGHAKRGIGGPPGAGTSNLHMKAGAVSRDDLIADIAQGVLVTELIGMGVNPVTGDYSRGASGFLIENGEIGAPVAEITIAGNLKDMFRELTPADDLEIIRGVDAPTLRIDGMMVAGA
ncbi:TldD/PmbA family protein [Parasphingopyxis lamellibrachiae]|uniref:Microcin-processing peptidase 1 n=1 Tax=Parasphingopyxis lamellibrachiae TaxID=680125 RepID=A0A3D9FEP7_9SPHN|nr:metallopeptidase TldD-related protein [Parasphingopyxis lamellibrachiae]RED16259.1 microcin-processing peptidase 1 [Parasphingopyxis lamellibrachiae]